MTTQVFHRKTCRLCDSQNVELVVKLEPIPLSEDYCNDSVTGKNAVRYPIDLYMCADYEMTGFHIFTKTLKEHSKNAKKYHKKQNQLGNK